MKVASSLPPLALGLLVLSMSLACPPTGWAVSLEFVPGNQTVNVGDPAVVDVLISGLGDGAASSVGTFDLNVSYDASILTAAGVTFGGFLGDGLLTSIQTVDLGGAGVADLAEVSLLFAFELDALQPASFTLATLTFDTLAAGTSPLVFSQALIGDGLGLPLQVNAGGGSVAAVPEPAFLLLLASGLAVLLAWRWRCVDRAATGS